MIVSVSSDVYSECGCDESIDRVVGISGVADQYGIDPERIGATGRSAIRHVDPSDPPILFLHSRDDTTVPWLQSREMYEAMKAAGIASELQVYETGGHAVRPRNGDPMSAMIAFFRKHLDQHDQ